MALLILSDDEWAKVRGKLMPGVPEATGDAVLDAWEAAHWAAATGMELNDG